MNDSFETTHNIAIIVPAYNVAPYVAECLDSILDQSYKNWECFVVDDGSTDETRNILKLYKCKDSRINVIFKDNGGVSSARNLALDVVEKQDKFDLVSFVDSDDRLDPEMYSSLVQSLERNLHADVAICGVYRFGEEAVQKPLADSDFSISNEEFVEVILSQGRWGNCCLSGGYVCRCLFKKHVIQGLRFSSCRDMVEDELYSIKVAKNVSRVAIVNKMLYGYRNRTGSLGHGKQFGLMQMNGRKCCIDASSEISEHARFISVIAYLPVAVRAFKQTAFPINLLTDYQKDLEKARNIGKINRNTYALYRLFTDYPLLSFLYRTIRKTLRGNK